jgi:hypothetical protein
LELILEKTAFEHKPHLDTLISKPLLSKSVRNGCAERRARQFAVRQPVERC